MFDLIFSCVLKRDAYIVVVIIVRDPIQFQPNFIVARSGDPHIIPEGFVKKAGRYDKGIGISGAIIVPVSSIEFM